MTNSVTILKDEGSYEYDVEAVQGETIPVESSFVGARSDRINLVEFTTVDELRLEKLSLETQAKEPAGLKRFLSFPQGERWFIILGMVIMIACLIMALIQAQPELMKILGMLVPAVYAADAPEASSSGTFGYKSLVGLAITAVFCYIYVRCVHVQLYSSNKEGIKAAQDHGKMTFGFLAGSARTYLGF